MFRSLHLFFSLPIRPRAARRRQARRSPAFLGHLLASSQRREHSATHVTRMHRIDSKQNLPKQSKRGERICGSTRLCSSAVSSSSFPRLDPGDRVSNFATDRRRPEGRLYAKRGTAKTPSPRRNNFHHSASLHPFSSPGSLGSSRFHLLSVVGMLGCPPRSSRIGNYVR